MADLVVKVERGRVWIERGVQSFMLAYDSDVEEERQWYAEQLRGALGIAGVAVPQALGNLLARIHRDGGHYIAQHGLAKALEDADAKIVAWLARDDADGVKGDSNGA